MRAREGLPLPPTEVTNQLLLGILARTQRDDKVTLCNFVDMNNHSHQFVIPHNPEMYARFYQEYQKKVTDTVRKLLRLKTLNLWEGRPSLPVLPKLEDAISRLIYIFLNPATAGLVNSIDDYPGISSWKAFKECEPSVTAEVKIEAKWTPVSRLKSLPANNRLSKANARTMAMKFAADKYTIPYDLVLKPLAWLACYDIANPEVIEAIRQRIIKAVYDGEAALRKLRTEKNSSVIGAEKLKQQEYLAPHTPKKKGRKIFVICGDSTHRQKIIADIKSICDKCRQCYHALKKNLPHEWPPGTFIPWIPPNDYHPALDLAFN